MNSDKEIEKLLQAIAAIEAQRDSLGDEIVEAAIAPMREKLSQLRAETSMEQRKFVSVLFADLAQFTPMAGKMDPEDLRDVLDLYFARWTACITEQEGAIEKFIGDAVMAVFGLPVSHEDDPQRAILAALAMQVSLVELNQDLLERYGIQLRMRVGIHTGRAVISTLGERTGQDFIVIGDMVNLSSRLQTAAPLDKIVISHNTYRHVKGVFDVQSLDPLQLKGIEEPVQAYVVLGLTPRAFRSITREVEGIETRMIGRDRELRHLQDELRGMLEDSKCRVVTIRGQAGVGKSRLIYEFDGWLELLPEIVYYFKGRAQPSMQDQPYALFRDLFAFRFQIHDSDGREEVWRKMSQGIQEAMGESKDNDRAAHFIGQLFNFDFHESPFLQTVTENPRQFHAQALAYLRDYFEALADRVPVILLLEDLHWADDSSLDLLSLLPVWLSHQRLLFVCAARPAFFDRRSEWGLGSPRHTIMDLNPLGRSESVLLVREILQKVENIPAELEEMVADSAEGNPFYVEELIKMMVEEGVIEKGEQRWTLLPGRLSQARVPPTLTGVLQARFDHLDRDERLLLQRASVLGRIFWDQALEFLGTALAGTQESGSSSPGIHQTRDLLAGLNEREMIFRRDRSTFENTAEFLFKHALLRDVIYESLLKRLRQLYHAASASWLVRITEANHRSDEFSAVIAGHYEGAGASEQAADWYQRAGEGAAARFANSEAVKLLSRAFSFVSEDDTARRYAILSVREKVYELQGNWQGQVEDLDILDELADKLDARGGAGSSHRAEVTLRRALLSEWRGDFQGASAAAQQAVALSEAANFHRGEIMGSLAWSRALIRQGDYAIARSRLESILPKADEFPGEKAAIHRALGVVAERQGSYGEAIEHYEQALALARQALDQRGEGNALNDLGAGMYYQGEYDKAAGFFEQALKIFREIGDLRTECVTLTNLGSIAYSQGDYRTSHRYFSAALKIDRETGDRSGESMDMNNLGRVALEQHDFSAAQDYLESSLRLSQEIQEPYNESLAVLGVGMFSLTTNQLDAAEAHLEHALTIFRTTEDQRGESEAMTYLSLLWDQRGEPGKAKDLCQEALSIANEIGARDVLANVHTIMGHLHLRSGDVKRARLAYESALDLHKELGQLHLTPGPLAGLAQISLLQGDLSAAQEKVKEILPRIESGLLEIAGESISIHLICYRVLHAAGDPHAEDVLNAGYSLLMQSAGSLQDVLARQSYLNAPGNRGLISAWESRP